jgi:hypothetical protein
MVRVFIAVPSRSAALTIQLLGTSFSPVETAWSMVERSASIWLKDWSTAWESDVACGSCVAPPAGATGLPGTGAEVPAVGAAAAAGVFAAEALTGATWAGTTAGDAGVEARVPCAHPVASAPTRTMPVPALQILLLLLILCLPD